MVLEANMFDPCRLGAMPFGLGIVASHVVATGVGVVRVSFHDDKRHDEDLEELDDRTLLEAGLELLSLVGSVLSTASDPADLNAAADELLEDELYQRAWSAFAKFASNSSDSAPPRIEREGDDLPALIAELDGSVQESIRLAVRLREASKKAHAQICANSVFGRRPSKRKQAAKLLDFLDNPTMPAAAKEAALASCKAEAYMAGVVAAAVGAAEFSLPQLQWIVANWVDQQRVYLTFLAGYPEADVSLDLVPESDRTPIAVTISRHKVTEAGYRARLAQARGLRGEADLSRPTRDPNSDT